MLVISKATQKNYHVTRPHVLCYPTYPWLCIKRTIRVFTICLRLKIADWKISESRDDLTLKRICKERWLYDTRMKKTTQITPHQTSWRQTIAFKFKKVILYINLSLLFLSAFLFNIYVYDECSPNIINRCQWKSWKYYLRFHASQWMAFSLIISSNIDRGSKGSFCWAKSHLYQTPGYRKNLNLRWRLVLYTILIGPTNYPFCFTK